MLVLNSPLLPFSSAAAACAKAGKKLATIDAVFGGKGAQNYHPCMSFMVVMMVHCLQYHIVVIAVHRVEH